MRNRLIAGAVALVLALGGTVVLLSYVQGADTRALAGAETRGVLVVTAPVAAGTAAELLAESVALQQVPVAIVAPGAVTELGALAGLVAQVDLQPGEQVLTGRFVSPDQRRAQGEVAVPEGMVTTSVLLDPQRALGGDVAAGDTVGVFISQVPPDGAGVTHLQLRAALVTAVRGAPAPVTADGTDPGADTASTSSGEVSPAAAASTLPSTSIMVTLALTPLDAERLVWGAEHGTLWLSQEPVGTPEGGTQVLDGVKVYQ